MAQFCVKTQALEQDRIKYVRNSLWVYTNYGSIHCCTDDKIYDKMREMLEKCSDVDDIDAFIKLKRTGSAKPAPINYECYYRDRSRHSNGHRMGNRPPAPLGQAPFPAQRGILSRNGSIEDPMYASVNPMMACEYVVAKCDYQAKGQDELSLCAGEMLTVIERCNSRSILVRNENGIKGYIRSDLVSEANFTKL